MPKESVYINKKSLVLFDLYAELDAAKRSKAYKEGKTETVRAIPTATAQQPPQLSAKVRTRQAESIQKAINGLIARFNYSKKSPLKIEAHRHIEISA